MTRNEDQRKHDLVESLLHSLYETDKEQSRSLVSAGMNRLGEDLPSASPKAPGSRKSQHVRYFPRWLTLGLATAAVLLIAFLIPMMVTSGSAMAAIQRSLDQALQDVGRHYEVNIVYRLSSDEVQTREADLYVKGGDRFAVCRWMSATGKGEPIWHGSNQDKSWVVPPIGPVLEGNRRNLAAWMDRPDGVSTPYMHITTALERMQQLYQLTSLTDDEVMFHGETVRCRRVTGYLKADVEKIAEAIPPPDQIDLWASRETGVAMKIVVTWNLADDQFGRESATIMLVEERELSDEFFTAEGHGAAERHRIDFATEREY